MTVVGLQWVQSTDTYSCPAADSIGSLTPATRVAACNAIDPWMSMVRCNLWAKTGVQTATYGDRCYTDTDVANMGQVMVKIKKFWYGTNHTGSAGSMTYRWYISSTGADSLPSGVGAWKVHPAFSRNSVTKSQIYLGAYEASGTSPLQSMAGVAPTVTQTLPQFRTAAEANGAGWEEVDFLAWSAVQLLYLLEYANFNSQSVTLGLGAGITGDTAAHNTGETGKTGTDRGNVSYGTASATTAVSYRGIENPWGNVATWLDGINTYGGEVYVADHGFVSDTFTSPYTDAGIVIAGAGGYMSDLAVTSTTDYPFVASALAGSSSTLIPDYIYAPAVGARVIRVGDMWSDGAAAGLWAMNDNVSTDSFSYIGGRLMYVG